ncbi:MAG: hypothetical protein AAB389_00245 [Patescibacteria group bacterium]
MLKKFYAVTQTSIYEVQDTENGPLATKIALRGSSEIVVGEFLKHGTMLSVGHNLWMFVPDGHGFMSPMTSYERDLGKVSSQWWGGHSSPVVALTLKKSDAEKCFKSGSTKICDPDWAEHTKAVLKAIGNDHPKFSLPSDPDLRLMDPAKL